MAPGLRRGGEWVGDERFLHKIFSRGPRTILDAIARVAGRLAAGRSRDEAIASRLRHQDLGARRVALDLLAKAVYVGFQRVGRHPGIVAPDFAKEGVAPDRMVAGAV